MSIAERYRIRGRRIQCEFSKDGRRCTSPATGVDHIVPQAVARLLGWPRRRTNARANLQLLCDNHHADKDKDVPELTKQLRERIARGNSVSPQEEEALFRKFNRREGQQGKGITPLQ